MKKVKGYLIGFGFIVLGVVIILLLLTYKLGSLLLRGDEKEESTGEKIGAGFIALTLIGIALCVCYLIGKLFLRLFPIL